MKSVEKNKISSHFLITFSLADLNSKIQVVIQYPTKGLNMTKI